MKTLAVSYKMKGGVLDDDYTLYEDGTVLHQYDMHTYPGGYNHEETLTVNELSQSVKERLLEAASNENKKQVRAILGL